LVSNPKKKKECHGSGEEETKKWQWGEGGGELAKSYPKSMAIPGGKLNLETENTGSYNHMGKGGEREKKKSGDPKNKKN